MILNLTAKDSTVEVKSKSIELDSEKKFINFLTNIEREVKKNPRKARKLKNLLISTQAVAVSLLVMASPTFAATATISSAPVVIPSEIVTTMLTIQIVCMAIGVGIALITLVLAGIWKMTFGKDRADAWTLDITKGLGQVLGAPVIVALIVGLFTLLFSGLPAFSSLIHPLGVFWGR